MVWTKYNKTVRYIIETLFPSSARARRVQKRALAPLCTHPLTLLLQNDTVQTLCSYTNIDVRDAIGAAKFEHDEAALLLLADACDDFLIEEACEHALTSSERLVVAPIPLHRARENSRGYNQVYEILARTRAVRDGFVEINNKVLLRTKHTEPQATLQREARMKNVAGAFGVDALAATPLKNRTFFIVDDVVTTGSTLSQAKKVMRKAGIPNVHLLSLARSSI